MNQIQFDNFKDAFLNNSATAKKTVKKTVRFLIKVLQNKEEGKYTIKVWDNMFSRVVFKALDIPQRRLVARFEDTVYCYKTTCTREYTIRIINEHLVYGGTEESVN